MQRKEPEYTREAQINHFEGVVVLSAVIDRDGNPRDIVVVRPVAVLATIEMNFRLL